MKKTLFLAALLLFPALSQGATLIHHWDFDSGDLNDKITNDNAWSMVGKSPGGGTPGITYPITPEITTGTGDYGEHVNFAGQWENGAFLRTGGDLSVASDFSMTIMGWINPAGKVDMALFGVGASDSEGFKIGFFGGGLKFTTKGVADFNIVGSNSISENVWSHVAVSINRTGNSWVIDYFLNGESLGTVTETSSMNIGNVAGFNIGSGSNVGQEVRSGSFDDVKIYDGTMTNDEVKLAMQGRGAAVPEPTTASLGLLGLTALLLRRRRLA